MRHIALLAALLFPHFAAADDVVLRVTVVDSQTEAALPCRAYLVHSDGKHHYFTSDSAEGSAVRYEKQNWINPRSTEYHTTLSAHPFRAKVPSGTYRLIVEHGKSYRAFEKTLGLSTDTDEHVRLVRWSHPVARGWYSGDTHIHRTIDELKNVVMAEDLNAVFPLTSWVTKSGVPPSAGDKNIDDARRSDPVVVDDRHVIWPRNTEYEIFTVGETRHTLGALFVLGHKQPLDATVPPWQRMIEDLRKSDPDVLYDLDKLDWPFAMLLPTIAPGALYELANNHVWRTEFAFGTWQSPTSPYLQPPFGGTGGRHREWLDYTHGMYYSLLNCGLRLPPSAGTANGVHPVPAGFGRVYVHLPQGFQLSDWMNGLRQGRSFVTTGPMLYATAQGNDPGHVFSLRAADATKLTVNYEIEADDPLLYGELIVNGVPEQTLFLRDATFDNVTHRAKGAITFQPRRSGWFALRVWQARKDQQARFAHTAPWYVEVDQAPVAIASGEKRYLVERMDREIERSRHLVGDEALREYERARDHYAKLPILDDADEVARGARPFASADARRKWLDNMVVDHRFTADEVRAATGLSLAEAQREIELRAEALKAPTLNTVRLRPYPGGRHPRRGFLDGAIDPQRETKISVFPPWENGGYVVVDVPEAIFSNLGLTYLAHTHVPTIWDGKSLERLEWVEETDGLSLTRILPNGIKFVTRVKQRDDGVDMRIDLTNGTPQKLTGLRVQVCTMLKGANGFNAQEPLLSRQSESSIAIRDPSADRWIVTSWSPIQRVWQNPPVPCVHADPIFPDCEPGKTVSVAGTLRFCSGSELKQVIEAASTR